MKKCLRSAKGLLVKRRIDEEIVARGLLKSRSEAKSFILEGKVLLNGTKAIKSNTPVKESDVISLAEPKKFVSRGGFKLDFALREFRISVVDLVALDIGVSTGGFTDCLLRNGAKKVYSVDVGFGQVDIKLRNDPHVILLERTNARYLTNTQIPEPIDIAVIDVSFISILKILGNVSLLIKDHGDIVSLIKPQFESERYGTKKGIVKDKLIHIGILKEMIKRIADLNLIVTNLAYSPIKGGKGNIEFFFRIRKAGVVVNLEDVNKIVEEAWEIIK